MPNRWVLAILHTGCGRYMTAGQLNPYAKVGAGVGEGGKDPLRDQL